MNKKNICLKIVYLLQENFTESEVLQLMQDKKTFSRVVNEILSDYEVYSKIKKNEKKLKKLGKAKREKKVLEWKIQANEKRKYIYEEASQHYSTGINFLSDLMGQIRGKLVDEYKKLTTSYEQRKSFKIHILNGIVNLFATNFLNSGNIPPIKNADKIFNRIKKLEDKNSNLSPEEGKSIKTGKENRENKVFKVEVKSKEDIERTRFVIPDMDKTGANAAYNLFKQIKRQIIEKYSLLDNEQDRKDFYEFLLANVEAEMNAAEEELRADLPEDKIKQIYGDMPKGAKETGEQEENVEETEGESLPETGGEDMKTQRSPQSQPPAEKEEALPPI